MGNAVKVKLSQWNISNIHKILKLDLFNHQLRCDAIPKGGSVSFVSTSINESKEEQTLMF
jgi:hypothetical protein